MERVPSIDVAMAYATGCFPPWLVQVEANLETREPYRGLFNQAFHPWLAQVEANLETREPYRGLFNQAFHLGSSRWKQIWKPESLIAVSSIKLSTLGSPWWKRICICDLRPRIPMIEALGNKRSSSVTKFATTWTSQCGKQTGALGGTVSSG